MSEEKVTNEIVEESFSFPTTVTEDSLSEISEIAEEEESKEDDSPKKGRRKKQPEFNCPFEVGQRVVTRPTVTAYLSGKLIETCYRGASFYVVKIIDDNTVSVSRSLNGEILGDFKVRHLAKF